MRWDDDAPHGGFTTGEPWLPAIEVHGGGVAAQAREPDSFLALYRDLVELRSALGDWLVFLDEAADGVLAYRRGRDHVVALNVCDEPRPAPVAGPVVRATHSARLPAGAPTPVHLQPGEGVVVRART